jgi:RNA polymerase sigma factor for flagellar operon FliA
VRERQFLEHVYSEGKLLMDAGAALGLSKSAASRLHARAVERLRKQLAALW